MKIKSHQEGGIIYTPFTRRYDQSYSQSAPAQTSNSTKSSSNNSDSIQKEIIDLLQENGLQSDVDYFLKQANRFLSGSGNNNFILNNPWASTNNQDHSYSISNIIKLQSLANRVKNNKAMFDVAVSNISKEKSGHEAAITSRGQLYVMTEEGEVKTINPNTYHENRDKYQALTNQELLYLRNESQDLAYNSSILGDLSNSIGMNTIIDHIKDVISDFGTDKVSSKYEKYTTKQQGQIERGFEQLLGLAPDGNYNVTVDESTSDQGYRQGNTDDLMSATRYLYSTLNEGMKNTLKAHVAAEGLDPTDSQNVLSLLVSAIQMNTDHSYDVSKTITGSDSGGSGTSSGGSGKMIELSREQMIGAGGVTDIVPITIASSNGHAGITIMSGQYGKPEDKNGNILGRETLTDLFMKDRALGGLGITSSVSFGDQLLSETDLDRVVYDGTSNIERAVIPYDVNVFATTGKYVPDLDAARRFEEFIKWREQNPDASSNKVFMKLQELDLNASINPDTGEFELRDSHVFLIVNGYASSKAFDFDTNSNWLVNLDDDEGERVFNYYKRILNYGSNQLTDSNRKSTGFKGGWFNNDGSMYKGAIFIPMSDANIATIMSGAERVPEATMTDIQNRNNLLRESRIQTNF